MGSFSDRSWRRPLLALSLLVLVLLDRNYASKGRGWPAVKSALVHYRANLGEISKIPYEFIVPTDDDLWPVSARGLFLGQIVSRIRNRGDFSSFSVELRELGVKTSAEMREVTSQLFAEALKYYQQNLSPPYVSGTPLTVPSKFKIPCVASYPLHLHEFPLGLKFSQWRKEQSNKPPADSLISVLLPGTVLPMGPLRNRCSPAVLLSALAAYQKFHGNMEIPHSFVCPSSDPFPPETHGLRLGHRVSHIRNRGSFPELRSKIDELGIFPWIATNDRELLSILKGLVDVEDRRSRNTF